jgi:hypothetical protein
MEKLKVGKIYKIIDNTNGNVYIGSTTKTLNQRLSQHKCDYKNYLNGRCYRTSFEIIKNNDYRIELIKYVIYKDKIELHQRERYYIENDICVNHRLPSRTKKEYCNNNKEYKKIYDKEYRVDNKEYIKEQKKEYYKERKNIEYKCECGSSINQYQKQRHFKTLKHINFINSN